MSLDPDGGYRAPKDEAAAAIARAQNELERAIEELERLPAVDLHSIALTAHALNNFLTVTGGVVELLIPTLRGYPDRQVLVWLEGLAHATDLMRHSVSQLMNNSVGIETTVRLEDIDLARLVERACAYYRRSAAQKGIELAFKGPVVATSVRTDRVLVAAILDNLVSNAVKYSPREKRVEVEVQDAGDGVACHVKDEGPGLSAADQERLFQPGVRLGATPSGGESSSGYGLAIAKRFVDQLGGRLTCASAPGRGATFTFWLPRAPKRP